MDLGAFIGPTLAGILFDSVGFPWATTLIIGVHIFVVIFLIGFSMCSEKSTLQDEVTGMFNMALPVVEFSREGYKIRKVFA